MSYTNKTSYTEKEIKEKIVNHSDVGDGWRRRMMKTRIKAGNYLTLYALSGTPPKGFAVYNKGNNQLCFYDKKGKRYIDRKGVRRVEKAEELKQRQYCPVCNIFVGNKFSQASHLFFKHGKELDVDWRDYLESWLNKHDADDIQGGICPLCFKDCQTEQGLFMHAIAVHNSVDILEVVETAVQMAKNGRMERVIQKEQTEDIETVSENNENTGFEGGVR